ncbi:3-oxo-5-alpha-steroid 4-dehydrogenase 1-like [Argonauta hians]
MLVFELNDQQLVRQITIGFYIFAIIVFFILFKIPATYGRYASRFNMCPVNCRVAWIIQESPCVWNPMLLLLFTDGPLLNEWSNRILLGMFLLHYFQRTCIYSVLIRGGKPTPLYTMTLAFLFCLFNSYIQTRSLMKYEFYPPGWIYRFHFIAGCILFLVGMAINIHSDHILRNLRGPNETGYKIPQGGMFKYLTSANLFGEILEWGGFALAGLSFPTLAFALNTLCVLVPRCYTHHKFYLEKFEDYPASRKIVLPFIW